MFCLYCTTKNTKDEGSDSHVSPSNNIFLSFILNILTAIGMLVRCRLVVNMEMFGGILSLPVDIQTMVYKLG